jgi:hypothetical protein
MLELVNMTNLPNIYFEDMPDVDDFGGSGAKGLGPQAYIYNPLTDKRFNLVNCDRAKSSIISKGESLEFWKRVALGANVDDV